MIFDTPQVYIKSKQKFARMDLDLTYLEQIPNAFSVWSKLHELWLTQIKLLLSHVELFFGHILIKFYNFLMITC